MQVMFTLVTIIVNSNFVRHAVVKWYYTETYT